MKKIIALFLSILLLIVPYSASASASTDVGNVNLLESDLVTTLIEVNTEEYQKIKFTNNETQEVEYLEVTQNADGSYIYKSISKDQELEIKNEEDTTIITNLKTKEVKKIENDEVLSNLNINASSDEPVPHYIYSHTTYGSRSLDVAAVSAIAGILASIYGGPVTGSLLSIAGFLYSASATDVWYATHTYYYSSGVLCTYYVYTEYYQDNNRTIRLGSSDGYTYQLRCNMPPTY